jgi:GH15 family glucan-1,4-alpha-glucosidase
MMLVARADIGGGLVALRIEDYGLIGDLHTAALVGTDGSIDWACFPRFDSPACFAALLGTEHNGLWQIAPDGDVTSVSRRYRDGTLVLETDFTTATGVARLTDSMPIRQDHPRIVRVVEGLEGSVPMRMRLRARFDYGKTKPWLRMRDGVLNAMAGPDAIELRSDVPIKEHELQAEASFEATAGQRVGFVLTHHPSWDRSPDPIDAAASTESTEAWWREWSDRSTYDGPWADVVQRSLITLKALIYAPSGGIVAAATTSLPEYLGGVRNWDYRYCWLRDAALTLEALMGAGYVDEATAWRDWVMRAVAGDPEDVQIMYGLGGERRLDEYELPHLAGYEGSAPVRIGNAASGQLQLDVYGELIEAIYRAQELGMQATRHGAELGLLLFDWLKDHWQDPDDGVWEVRGGRKQFVHSKVMVWVAFDRLEKMAESMGLAQAAEPLRQLRDAVHEEICREGYDAERNTFTQSYGSKQLDASLLLIPMVGFLPADDPRAIGTVEAIQRELVKDGFVMRYIPDEDAADGLPPGEGAFLACSFWLVNDLALMGRRTEAEELFERLLSLRNDLGLFSEEYDQEHERLIGNVPQAFTHLTLIASAIALGASREA